MSRLCRARLLRRAVEVIQINSYRYGNIPLGAPMTTHPLTALLPMLKTTDLARIRHHYRCLVVAPVEAADRRGRCRATQVV